MILQNEQQIFPRYNRKKLLHEQGSICFHHRILKTFKSLFEGSMYVKKHMFLVLNNMHYV